MMLMPSPRQKFWRSFSSSASPPRAWMASSSTRFGSGVGAVGFLNSSGPERTAWVTSAVGWHPRPANTKQSGNSLVHFFMTQPVPEEQSDDGFRILDGSLQGQPHGFVPGQKQRFDLFGLIELLLA